VKSARNIIKVALITTGHLLITTVVLSESNKYSLKKYIVTKIFKLIINEYIKKTRITILLYPGFWGHFSNFLISVNIQPVWFHLLQ
jgi:hypothetical protein